MKKLFLSLLLFAFCGWVNPVVADVVDDLAPLTGYTIIGVGTVEKLLTSSTNSDEYFVVRFRNLASGSPILLEKEDYQLMPLILEGFTKCILLSNGSPYNCYLIVKDRVYRVSISITSDIP